jgi:hypothetical protein
LKDDSRMDKVVACKPTSYHNDDVVLRLSDQGVDVTGKTAENRLTWPVYTKARRFSDGLLLFQGPHMFNWLPDTAADAETIRYADGLVRKHIGDYRNV